MALTKLDLAGIAMMHADVHKRAADSFNQYAEAMGAERIPTGVRLAHSSMAHRVSGMYLTKAEELINEFERERDDEAADCG